MLSTNQVNILSAKLLQIFPKAKYEERARRVTINNKSFIVPKAPRNLLSSRTTLTR